MLTYFLSASNEYTIRTVAVQPDCSGSYSFGYLGLQDMMTLKNSTAVLQNASYNPYESLFTFTVNIASATTGSEYRAVLYTSAGTEELWHGSIQVFTSQSIDKANYTNQIPLGDAYVSNVSTNEYILY